MSTKRHGNIHASAMHFVLIGVILVMAATAPAQGPQWLDAARKYAAAHPENKGLPHLIEALSQIDFKSIAPHDAKIKAIAADGWTQPYPEIQQLLQSKSAALAAAVKAADAAPFELPPTTSVETPVLDYLNVTMVFRLLACEARRLEAAGDLAGAAQRAVQAARFSLIPASKDQGMIGILLGISGMGIIHPTLEAIIANPTTPRETLQFIGASLYDIEKKRIPSWTAFEVEKKTTLEGLGRLDEFKQSYPEMAKEIEPYAKHKYVYVRIMDATIENEKKPYWQRQPAKAVIDAASDGTPVKFNLINSDESTTREAVMLAKMRLLQAQCAERLGLADAAAQFQDPFSGQPLKITPQLIYSLGPDKTDQQGVMHYDAGKGTFSTGDIVLKK